MNFLKSILNDPPSNEDEWHSRSTKACHHTCYFCFLSGSRNIPCQQCAAYVIMKHVTGSCTERLRKCFANPAAKKIALENLRKYIEVHKV